MYNAVIRPNLLLRKRPLMVEQEVPRRFPKFRGGWDSYAIASGRYFHCLLEILWIIPRKVVYHAIPLTHFSPIKSASISPSRTIILASMSNQGAMGFST